ncbi:PqqD family protein [bacterium]|nr:PqqD family protein [bacterium]
MMSKKKKFYEEPSFLQQCPERRLEWEMRDEQLVTLIIPKFKSKYTVKWLVPMLAKPNFKVKLDAYGSFVWLQCDGQTTIESIVHQMHERYNDSVESMRERVGSFVAKLSQDGFLNLSKELQLNS